MTIDDICEEEFGVFVNWMHTNTITLSSPPSSLIKVWILGERFLVPQVQNAALDAL
jgi:hypothetical protein